jgi:hypothetical protein
MNLKEGTRRLALLLGVVGAICGGVASYVESQPTVKQRALHIQFDRLAASKAVAEKINILQATPDFVPAPWVKYAEKNAQTPPGKYSLSDIDPPEIDPRTGERISSPSHVKEYDPWELAAAEYGATIIKKDGVRSIHWSKEHGVESIETDDGQILYPTAAPEAWKYVLLALFPVFGFLITWGTIRAIAWVGIGFVQTGGQQ